jgi:DNA-binding Xre family transcriptional regulator
MCFVSEEHENLIQIEWRLEHMMLERGIRRVTELKRRMNDLGIDISNQQLGRIVREFPERLNTLYLRGILTVLNCNIADIIKVNPPNTGGGAAHKDKIIPIESDRIKRGKRNINVAKRKEKASSESTSLAYPSILDLND